MSISLSVLALLAGCGGDDFGGGMGSTSGVATGGTGDDGAADSDSTTSVGEDEADSATEADAPVCELATDSSCAQMSAEPVRGLVDDEFLGASVRDPHGPHDFVFSSAAATRTPPRPQHPGYLFLFFELWEGDIRAPLSESTRNELLDLATNVPTEAGSYTPWLPEMTLRIADRQLCFDTETNCSTLVAVYERLLELDELLLSRWDEQSQGSLYVLDEIEVHDWPLALDLSVDGRFEVSEADSDMLFEIEGGSGWFVDRLASYAHMQQSCTGTDGDCGPPQPGEDWDLCCDTWYVDIAPARLESSPLGPEENAALLEQVGEIPYAPLQLEGDAFTALHDTHILSFPDPDEAETIRLLAVLARPRLHLETPL